MAETTGSATGRSRMVTGLFRDRESAERAYGSVTTRGYSNDDVNLLMSDDTRKKHLYLHRAVDLPEPCSSPDFEHRHPRFGEQFHIHQSFTHHDKRFHRKYDIFSGCGLVSSSIWYHQIRHKQCGDNHYQ